MTVKRKRRGSPKGKISFLERIYNFGKRWIFWLGTVLFYGIGEAATYVKENADSIKSAMPWWAMAGILGAVGVVLMMKDNKKIKETNTLEVEERN